MIINKICITCKCYIMKELTFVNEFILIKQVHQKSGTYVKIGIF